MSAAPLKQEQDLEILGRWSRHFRARMSAAPLKLDELAPAMSYAIDFRARMSAAPLKQWGCHSCLSA